MIGYFYENDKLYFGKIGFISYLQTYLFPSQGYLITLKNIKGYEEYAYYPHNKYVLIDINRLHFLNHYNKSKSILENIEIDRWEN